MATYSIAEVEQLTGIQAHTLRIWERRYDIIKAKRTDTKIRYYDDAQLKLLLNVSILLRHGYRVSAIDKMEEDQICNITHDLLSDDNGGIEKDVKGLVMSMLSLDESVFSKIFETYRRKHGLGETVVELIYPFLHQVGLLWGANRAMPAQEHFVSNLIRKKIFGAIEKLPEPDESAKKFVLFLPEGDYHEIGLLLSYYLAMEAGLKVYYLGQNVPSEDVIQVNETVQADFIMTILILPKTESELQLAEICAQSKTKLLLAGNLSEVRQLPEGAQTFSKPREFINFLKECKRSDFFV